MTETAITWTDVATLYPVFVQWAVTRHGPLPDGEVKMDDYDRLKTEFEAEVLRLGEKETRQ